MRMSWRFTRVLSGTVEPKSRRSSFGWSGHCSVLKTLSCVHWHYVTRHPWPCPESYLGWACRSCPDTRLHPQTPVSLSCQSQTHLSCPPMMLREASNSVQTVPGQGRAGMAPSCWASCGQAQDTYSPVLCHLLPVWAPDLQVCGRRPHRGQGRGKGSCPYRSGEWPQ